MPDNSYSIAIEWLFHQFPAYHKVGAQAYKPDLSNCLALCSFFDDPHKKLNFIHVAGTNGKGSTASLLASILQESGKKTGLFTSPHIEDFRERIRIDGEKISKEEVLSFCDKIRRNDLPVKPSFFEITWVMALAHFNRMECDICVIETGLGGRLDATNVILPILSIITNIGLEHTNFLGNSLASIAAEKGGIIKPAVPVVIGEATAETLPVFENIAQKNNTVLHLAERIPSALPANFPLLGKYQEKNFQTVSTAISLLNRQGFQIDERAIQLGVTNLSLNTGFRGRLQIISQLPLTLLDVSHNYDGIKATLESLSSFSTGKIHLLYGTSSDKDLSSIFTLFPKNYLYYFTEFTNERSAKLKQLRENSQAQQLNSCFFKRASEALQRAQKSASKEDTILITGSFFLLNDFF
jgi:dihydrofolate synthase / folylpolyglutamate synthase